MSYVRPPCEIEALIHCHCYCEPLANTPAYVESLARLQRAQLVTGMPDEHGVYRTTDAGRVLIDALCNVPNPVLKWEIPAK